MSRQGKHKRSKVSVGFYVERDFRALLALVCDISGKTATEIMMQGVRNEARACGMYDGNDLKQEYKNALEVIKAAYDERKATK